MKKGNIGIQIGIILVSLIVLIGGGTLIYEGINRVQRQKILRTPLQALTMEEKFEDFEYLYKTIVENYPYLDVNERMNGVNWIAQKEAYLEKVKETRNDNEFTSVLNQVLSELHNGHTHLLDRGYVQNLQKSYGPYKGGGSWQEINYDIVTHPLVLRRYNVTEASLEQTFNGNNGGDIPQVKNARVKDVLKGQVGYLAIPQMISPYEMQVDKELIDEYLQEIKNYNILIIDIRGNGGGNSSYWHDYLMPALIDKTYDVSTYEFFKDGEMIQKFFKADKWSRSNRKATKDVNIEALPYLPEEVKRDFPYALQGRRIIEPSKDSIHFKGKVYLLVDRYVYSSAEMFAMYAKDSGFATLVGEKTGGDGIGSDPLLAMLPNSGLVFRFTKEMGTSADGTCNEEYKTMPDYEIENAKSKTEFLEDHCIEKVLELESIQLD